MREKKHGVIFTLTAAVFLAGVLVPVFVAAQETRPAPQAAERQALRAPIRESLGLTTEQEKALEEFRKARVEENRGFREEMRKLRAEISELAKDPKANQAKIDGLIDKAAKLRADREKAAFRNRAERDKIFTPEQLEKMKALRSRFQGRPGLAGRAMRGLARMGFRGPGRFMGPRFGPGRGARLRAFRHRPFLWRFRD